MSFWDDLLAGGLGIGAGILTGNPMVGLGVGSAVLGMTGTNNSNPNQQFGDPNSPYYQMMQQNYYKGLQNTLNATSPGQQSLMAMSMARGGDYGGSSYIAGKQRQDIMTQNNTTAANSTNNFMTNMYGQGMNTYAQGNVLANQNQNSFANNLIGLGGGLLGRYFTQQQGQGQQNDNYSKTIFNFDNGQQQNQNGYGSEFTQGMVGQMPQMNPYMNNYQPNF